MVALVLLVSFMAFGAAVCEGIPEGCHKLKEWSKDRKLFKQNRKAMRLYY